MYTQEQERRLMNLTVTLAERSIAEDRRIHPAVGAIIADERGEVICQSFRGESLGEHAESNLLIKARKKSIALERCALFTSLEPCTIRGDNKIPCVEQIAQTPIPTVYIGTLDPNPAITGRGEMFLTYLEKTVRRFQGDIQDRLQTLNEPFFVQHRHEYVQPWSMHAPSDFPSWQPTELDRVIRKPYLSMDRNALLLQTNDLIFGSNSDIWCSAGGLSWFRESFISYLCARLRGLSVRLICSNYDLYGRNNDRFIEAVQAARSIGVSITFAPRSPRMKATIVSPYSDSCAAIVIDSTPHLFYRACEPTIIELILKEFERGWNNTLSSDANDPDSIRFRDLTEQEMAEALSNHVEEYTGETIRIVLKEVEISNLLFLTRHLERFKLFRLQHLSVARTIRSLPEAICIEDCPWPITPPVIEQRSGSLVIIDGAHRVYASHMRGEKHIVALVVRGVDAPLSAEPVGDATEVSYQDKKLERELRYTSYSPGVFRQIRLAMQTLCAH